MPAYITPNQRIPAYLPYPEPVSPGWHPVPNASAVNWPQAQFAPEFLPPGDVSFQPYVYPDLPESMGPPASYPAEEYWGEAYGGCGCAKANPKTESTLLHVGMLLGAFALGYLTCYKQWDLAARAYLKEKL